MENSVPHITEGIPPNYWKQCPTCQEGDIVLVHNHGPTAYWKLAVIENVIVGHDGLFRAASIHTNGRRTNRPISRLYPLEIASKTDSDLEPVDLDTTPNQGSPQTTRDVPPMRQATCARWTDWTSIYHTWPWEDGSMISYNI